MFDQIRAQAIPRRNRSPHLHKVPRASFLSRNATVSVSQGKTIRQSPLFAEQSRKLNHIHLNFGKAARFRSGTIKLKIPVETNSGSSSGAKSFGGQAQSRCQFFFFELGGFERRFLLSHGHALRPAIFETNLHRQNSRAGLLHDVNATFLRGNDAKFRKKKPCPITG